MDTLGGAGGPPPNNPPPPPPPPSVDIGIPGIIDAVEIGRGGFAVVYRGHRQSYDQTVAVKVLAAALDASSRQRFDSEVRAMGALFGHPHIVGIISAGYTIGDRPYIVMEDMTGGSLADALRTRRTYSWQEATEIGVGLASALEAAHSAHVLHCDVKPENVLYSRYGAPKLGDFGLAALAEGPETRSTAVMVSVAHAAPEVLDGAPRNPGTDVYALASTIMTLILGRPPFARSPGEAPAAIFKRISTDPPPDLRGMGVPDGVCRVLERAMAKTPDARYSSASLFRTDLERARQAALSPAQSAPGADTDLTEAWTPPGVDATPSSSRTPDPVTPVAIASGPPAASAPPVAPARAETPAPRAAPPRATPPARPRTPALSPRTLLIAGGAAAVVVIAVVLFLVLRGHGPTPAPHSTAVTATSATLAVSPDRLATVLARTPFSQTDIPKAWSATGSQLENVRFSSGQVAAIDDALHGPASELDVNYLVYADQGDALSGYAGSGAVLRTETMVGQFKAAGVSDPIKCGIGTPTGSTQQLWYYDCLARSGDVMSYMFVTLSTRDDRTGESLATTMSIAAIKNLAAIARSVPAGAFAPPPSSFAPSALFEQLLTAPFDASLVPSVVSAPAIQAEDVAVGANGPFNLIGDQRILLTLNGSTAGTVDVGNYVDYYIFKTPADAQTWFGAGLAPVGATQTGSIDSSGFSQQIQCHTFTLPATDTRASVGASVCYVLWGDTVIDAFSESTSSPQPVNEILAVTLARMALMDLAETEAKS
jgi:serine/threonine protein kinase